MHKVNSNFFVLKKYLNITRLSELLIFLIVGKAHLFKGRKLIKIITCKTMRIKNFFTNVAIVVFSVLLIAVVGYATTTISSNISTGGTLSVTGNATTSANLVVGTTDWAAPTSTLSVVGNAIFHARATTSDFLWIGTAGNPLSINYSGGDLYVENDAEIDGLLYLDRATSTSATTTNYLFVGVTFPVNSLVDYTNDLIVSDDVIIAGTASTTNLIVNGAATTTGNMVIGTTDWAAPTSTLSVVGNAIFHARATTSDFLWIGTAGNPLSVNYSGGDLYVQNDAEIDGLLYLDRATSTSATTTNYLFVGVNFPVNSLVDYTNDLIVSDDAIIAGTASSTNLVVNGSATTTGNMVIGYNKQLTTATTTITLGSYDSAGAGNGVCLKIWQGGAAIYCIATTGGDALNCSTNSCE